MMYKTIAVCKQLASFAVAAVLLLSQADAAPAGQISHHGRMVDEQGSAMNCLSCHDGTLAHSSRSCTVKCDANGAHSILKRYPPPGKELDYAPVSVITAQGIRLENGKVSCISCHDLRNNGKHHIVKLTSGGYLCSVCHRNM